MPYTTTIAANLILTGKIFKPVIESFHKCISSPSAMFTRGALTFLDYNCNLHRPQVNQLLSY